MGDYLVAATLSNLLVSTILAVLAWVAQRRISSPGLTNLLWAVVLIKMVTPPMVAIPAMTIPSIAGSNIPANADRYAVGSSTPFHRMLVALRQQTPDIAESRVVAIPTDEPPRLLAFAAPTVTVAIVFWVVGSAILLAVSTVRILRFHGLLMATAHVHQELSRGLASDIAGQFGLQKAPNIVVTAANIAPFVWWLRGRCVIVVSSRATQELNQTDLRLIITHEMAHVKRRDHWFRWLEWLVLTAFWWNPIMWWARQQLRISEEMACDQLVLQTSKSKVNQYANSLLNMAELLTSPEIRPPVVASALNSGGSFERRLNAMMTEKFGTAPAVLRPAVVAMAMCLFPLGFVCAQDFEAVERRLGGAVEAGELSLAHANLMMEALRRSSSEARDMEARKHHYMMFTKEIKAAVAAGKLSEEEAEEKLTHLRREMFESERHAEKQRQKLMAKTRRYEQVAREIKEAHEAGKLSEEEAEEKLTHLRREMFESGRHDEKQRHQLMAKKRRYEQVAREIKEAHEAGKLSEEEAEEKLIHLRREMFESGRHDEEDEEDED